MTRFQLELAGKFGEYWKNDAEKRMREYADEIKVKATIEEDGAIRWNSGNYIPDDYCEVLEAAGVAFSREATAIKRDAQQAAFIAEYRNRRMTEEEKAEISANFPKGTKVVDIFSGEEYIA